MDFSMYPEAPDSHRSVHHRVLLVLRLWSLVVHSQDKPWTDWKVPLKSCWGFFGRLLGVLVLILGCVSQHEHSSAIWDSPAGTSHHLCSLQHLGLGHSTAVFKLQLHLEYFRFLPCKGSIGGLRWGLFEKEQPYDLCWSSVCHQWVLTGTLSSRPYLESFLGALSGPYLLPLILSIGKH